MPVLTFVQAQFSVISDRQDCALPLRDLDALQPDEIEKQSQQN
jgi:hypothetical protein